MRASSSWEVRFLSVRRYPLKQQRSSCCLPLRLPRDGNGAKRSSTGMISLKRCERDSIRGSGQVGTHMVLLPLSFLHRPTSICVVHLKNIKDLSHSFKIQHMGG